MDPCFFGYRCSNRNRIRVPPSGGGFELYQKPDSTKISGSETLRLKGDLYLWIRLLIPGVVKRVYNMQNKQMVKIFSRYEIMKPHVVEVLGFRVLNL